MQLFYCPDILSKPCLSDQEATHAARVLRLSAGDTIHVIDGKGNFYTATLTAVSNKKCDFNILEVKSGNPSCNYSIHVAMAPVKNMDRTEWFVEKSIELGIQEITFLECQHSERKSMNMERIEKIAVSAMKQSLKSWLPKINPMLPFKKFVGQNNSANKFIAHLEQGERRHLVNAATPKSSYLILIGPEGDFSPQEINYALQNQYLPVTLGGSRLRTETAGIAACHILNLIHDREIENTIA